MRDEIPAALPLIVFITALALEPALVNAGVFAAGLAAVALLSRNRRVGAALLFAATGTIIGSHERSIRAEELAAFNAMPPEKFLIIEAPLERDWSWRPHVHILRTSSFRVADREFPSPLSVYTRFPPPPFEMEAGIQIEGHLRRDGNGRYSVAVKSARLISYTGRLPLWSPASWNRLIANRLREHAAARPREVAMIEALVLGRGERLNDETRDQFKRGGTYHLLVFSGLQISLAGAAIAMLLRWIGAPRASDWTLLSFSAIAPLFIGPGASVSRASIGIALYAVSRIARRPTTFENLWCVAALVRLVVVPGDLTDPAFHLTYAGAGALLFIGKPMAASRLRMLGYVVAAELAIAPLTLFHFHQYALGGSLMTIVMTPIVLVMLVVGAVFAATEASILLDAIALLNAVCMNLNTAAAPAAGFFAAPPLAAMIAAASGSLMSLAILRGRLRTAAVMAAISIPLAAAIVTFAARGRVASPSFTMLNVGQGDAMIVRAGRQTLLVDGGGRHDDIRFGENVLLPLLLDRGIRDIHAAVLTHAHPDHCGGLIAAVQHLRVRELWISPRRFRGDCASRLLAAAGETATPIRLVHGGEKLSIGPVDLETLVASRRFKRAPENNSSVILRAHVDGRTILMTGDIEKDAEADLAERLGPADVLKIPHHGSRTSSTSSLLDTVRPRIALISCGRNNFFGHPHPSVLDSLRRRRVRVWRTDRHGSIELIFSPGHISVRPEIDTPE